MIQKELNELRRRLAPGKNNISKIYGCFVNSNREIVSYLDESLGQISELETEKYLGMLKKALSGRLGKNLIDIVFSTQQVQDSDEHRRLMALKTSELKDADARKAFYQNVIESLDMDGGNYLLLLACDACDVPHRGKGDEVDADASDEVFNYFVCAICPVKDGKPELGYFSGENEFHDMAYGDMVAKFREAESAGRGKQHLTGYVVFTQDSFQKEYSELSRTYAISSDNKAFIPNMGGYSIYASCLDGTNTCVRWEQYKANEYGGADGRNGRSCWFCGVHSGRVCPHH